MTTTRRSFMGVVLGVLASVYVPFVREDGEIVSPWVDVAGCEVEIGKVVHHGGYYIPAKFAPVLEKLIRDGYVSCTSSGTRGGGSKSLQPPIL